MLLYVLSTSDDLSIILPCVAFELAILSTNVNTNAKEILHYVKINHYFKYDS
jgi:hypothetical protein